MASHRSTQVSRQDRRSLGESERIRAAEPLAWRGSVESIQNGSAQGGLPYISAPIGILAKIAGHAADESERAEEWRVWAHGRAPGFYVTLQSGWSGVRCPCSLGCVEAGRSGCGWLRIIEPRIRRIIATDLEVHYRRSWR